jgi:hypothetical protein
MSPYFINQLVSNITDMLQVSMVGFTLLFDFLLTVLMLHLQLFGINSPQASLNFLILKKYMTGLIALLLKANTGKTVSMDT